jgi:hypothetical protein
MALAVDRTLRLPPTEHFPAGGRKTGIAIHHTVGGSAASTLEWWRNDRQMVGTAYLIDRDGTVHEVFDPAAWAWQFGLKWPNASKLAFEKRFIGIEIASEGALVESNGELYCFDRISPRTRKARSEALDFGSPYRGYRYFDRYEPSQIDALVLLIDELCDRFAIPRRVPGRFTEYYGPALSGFEGIIGHAMVRTDKSDPVPDAGLWERLVRECRLTVVDPELPAATVTAGVRPGGGAAAIGTMPSNGQGAAVRLDGADIEALFEANIHQIHVMNVAAGSMVKGLCMELERAGRNTYIRLRDAIPRGHAVEYDFVQGDRRLVGRIGRALGFEAVTDSRLEVRRG